MKRELDPGHLSSAPAVAVVDGPAPAQRGLGHRDFGQRDLVQRIVASPTFARSERLSTLLTYVCDMTFKGREEELNEQRIGQAVFGRSEDYDSSIDGIVRTQASRLRNRLDLYFQQEGVDEPVRLVIPRGGYVPLFEPRLSPPTLTAPSPEPPPPVAASPAAPPLVAAPKPRRETQWLPWMLCGLLLMAVVVLYVRDRRLQHAAYETATPHALWGHLLVKGETTLVIPADSGLVLYHNISGRTIGLNEYLQGQYRVQPFPAMGYRPNATLSEWTANLADRRYTSMVDLNAIDSLERLAEAQGHREELQIRYARDVRPNDLKSGNAILFGASEANPWVELYERNLNFVFHNDYQANVFSVMNRAPKNGEPKQWDSVWNDPQRRVYCLIAYVPSLAGNGNALIIEGTSMSGTEGAWDFVSDDTKLLPFLKTIQHPDGSIPHFELLLGNQNMNASAVQSRVLAWRVID